MHGHKNKNSDLFFFCIRTGMGNTWNVDDDSHMFHANQKRKRRFRLEDENSLEKENDFEEDFQEEDYEEEK